MRVLLSIKPEFVRQIFDGTKRYEYRKILFRDKTIKSVVVYATYPICKVVGEFKIKDIYFDTPTNIWNQTKQYGGIDKERYLEYYKNTKKAVAIQIGTYKEYAQAKKLSDYGISHAPQSFVYIK